MTANTNNNNNNSNNNNNNNKNNHHHNDNTNKNNYLSDAALLKIGTWNCQGLSKVKKDLALSLDMDVLCVTETHKWKDSDKSTIYSDLPPETDSWSGVALILSNRVIKYVISSGSIGSRITYCRLRGNICNYFIVGVYIPQRKRTNPDQNDVYTQLQNLLLNIRRQDCIVLLGDFNSRLPRNQQGFVGRW